MCPWDEWLNVEGADERAVSRLFFDELRDGVWVRLGRSMIFEGVGRHVGPLISEWKSKLEVITQNTIRVTGGEEPPFGYVEAGCQRDPSLEVISTAGSSDSLVYGEA